MKQYSFLTESSSFSNFCTEEDCEMIPFAKVANDIKNSNSEDDCTGDIRNAIEYIDITWQRTEDFKKIPELKQKFLKENLEKLITATQMHANACALVGKYYDAKDYHEMIYRNRAELYGEESPYTIAALMYLSCDYDNIGDYEKAVNLGEKVRKLSSDILGDEDETTALSYLNLQFNTE